MRPAVVPVDEATDSAGRPLHAPRPPLFTRARYLQLLTWCTWLGANLTMAAWLHEHNGRRANGAVLVNLLNATMCALTAGLIGWYRL
jgi:hypothetical protein